MIHKKNITALLAALGLALGGASFVGCERDTGDHLEDAGESIGDAAEQAPEDIGDALDN